MVSKLYLETTHPCTDVLAQLADIKSNIDGIKSRGEGLGEHVRLFKLPVQEYTNLADAVAQYEGRVKLWSMVSDFEDKCDEWYTTDIRTVDAEALTVEVTNTFKESFKMSKQMAEDQVVAKLVDTAKKVRF